MPRKPKKPCAFPGCPELTEETYCEAHRAQVSAEYNRYTRDPEDARRYDRRWRKARERYVAKHPFCEECLKDKRLTKTQMVHHLRPLAEGGDHSEANLEALCWACHNRLHPDRGQGRPNEY